MTTRRPISTATVCVLVLLALAGLPVDAAFAGPPLPVVVVGQAASNVSVERSFLFEIAIVVVMFGAALFAVCRSSQRR